MISPRRRMVKKTLKKVASIEGNSRLPTAPMPAMSAPIFMMMAGKLNNNMRYNTGLG